MTTQSCPVTGAGLGLRRSFITELADTQAAQIDFMEVAPENWMGMGGRFGRQFAEMAERFQMICHGLSLSIGSPAPLDEVFLQNLKQFFNKHHICCYSEHLSYCSDDGHLYDLMPVPFTEEAVRHVAARIQTVQEIVERPLILENISYYAAPGQQMNEIDFFNAVIEEADCDILLDVNNVYVNSINHDYDAVDFIKSIASERIAYLHIAGHYNEADDLIIDTHGADVIDPVWQLLDETYQIHGVVPTLLERDFNIPSLETLLQEIDIIHHYQHRQQNKGRRHG